MLFIYWLIQCAFNRPSLPESLREGLWFETTISSPLRNGERYSMINYNAVGSCVVGLLSASRPYAIIRRVVSVIVDAFNGMAWRWLVAHVTVEIQKRILPRSTKLYPASSIILVGMAFRIVASITNTSPTGINWRFAHAMSFMRTTTRFSVAGFYMLAFSNSFIAALANTIPFRGLFGMKRNDCKLVVSATGEVDKYWHNILRWILLRLKCVKETVTEYGIRSLNLSNTGAL